MTVAYANVADAVSNITAMTPVVQDSVAYAANWFVQHPIGILTLSMVLFAFGIGVIKGLVRGRRGRR